MTTASSSIQSDYKYRVNNVFKYIDENIDSNLSLNEIAKAAHFSPYHFHRVFKYVTGETVNEYVIRKRIEKAAGKLLHTDMAVSQIASQSGFTDHATFTKAFKRYYDISPTAFKQQNTQRFSKIRQLQSKNRQAYPSPETYVCIINKLKNWIKMNAKIEVRKMQEITVACVSAIGSKNLEVAYQQLIRWATPKGLMNNTTKMATIYHDSFKITSAEKVRMSACLILNSPVQAESEIEIHTIPGGKYIIGNFEIGLEAFEKSWTGLFLWMNDNGYTKDDRNPFEIYHNNPTEHPDKIAIVDFYIPIT